MSLIVKEEAEMATKVENFGVFVCGPLSMQSDVSAAVVQEQLRTMQRGNGDVTLHLEHFSWA